MPKIVDRDAYKKELAERAAGFFSRHGYDGIGMRGIAVHLGVSKSALYHYFPTKESLFLACTETIMQRISEVVPDPALTQDEQLQVLLSVIRPGFSQEMALLFEYLRPKNQTQIAQDEAMQVSLSAYLKLIEPIVGADQAVATLEILIGKLMLDYLSGGTLSSTGPETSEQK